MTPEESAAKLFETDMDLDIIDGVQEGWRVWLVSKSFWRRSVQLQSVWHPRDTWSDKRFEATCIPMKALFQDGEGQSLPIATDRVSCGMPPNRDCGCGIHAFKMREDAELYAREHFLPKEYSAADLMVAGVVLGRVALYGDVLDCEDHWRGLYAYPKELYLLRGDPRLAPALEKRYRIPASVALIAQESL